MSVFTIFFPNGLENAMPKWELGLTDPVRPLLLGCPVTIPVTQVRFAKTCN